MYIRIQDNAIRFRISPEEAQDLLEGEVLLDAVPLNKVLKLTYSVESTSQLSKFEYSDIDHCLSLKINQESLKKEMTERPSKSGISIDHHITSEKILAVSLEIDLKKHVNESKK